MQALEDSNMVMTSCDNIATHYPSSTSTPTPPSPKPPKLAEPYRHPLKNQSVCVTPVPPVRAIASCEGILVRVYAICNKSSALLQNLPQKKRRIQKSQPIGREVIVNKRVQKTLRRTLKKKPPSRRGKRRYTRFFFAKVCCRLFLVERRWESDR
jgi:hypothetical protein